MLKIIINGSILDNKPTGLGIFVYNVLNNIRYKKDIEIFLFSPVEFYKEGITTVKITKYVMPKYGKVGAFIRFLWVQFVLPFKYYSYIGYKILYNPTHHAPIIIKNQLTN